MVDGIRFIGVPRSVLNNALSMGVEWRTYGELCRVRAMQLCPVGESAPHLRDTLEARFIGGGDPRILIGSRLTVEHGTSLLGIVNDGTPPHSIDPKKAGGVLAFDWPTAGGMVFLAHVNHPGTAPNRFIEKAIGEITRAAAAA